MNKYLGTTILMCVGSVVGLFGSVPAHAAFDGCATIPAGTYLKFDSMLDPRFTYTGTAGIAVPYYSIWRTLESGSQVVEGYCYGTVDMPPFPSETENFAPKAPLTRNQLLRQLLRGNGQPIKRNVEPLERKTIKQWGAGGVRGSIDYVSSELVEASPAWEVYADLDLPSDGLNALNFIYRWSALGDGDYFGILVNSRLVFSTAGQQPSTEIQEAMIDLSPWAGQRVTISLVLASFGTAQARFEVIDDLQFTPAVAPEVTPRVTGPLGNDGWYLGNVSVDWDIVDPQGDEISTRAGCDPITLTEDTGGTSLVCTATSVNGTAQGVVTVRKDSTAPLFSVVAPQPGASYLRGQRVEANFACQDATSGIASCVGSTAAGDPLDTEAIGPHQFSLTATDVAGNSVTRVISYEVKDLARDATPPVVVPTVTGTAGDTGWYRSDVGISWGVSDDESPIESRVGCEPLLVVADTNGVTSQCSAASTGGVSERSVTVKRDTVAPISVIAFPWEGVTLKRGQKAYALYACLDLRSGLTQCTGSVANLSALDTSTPGVKVFTLLSRDKAGNSHSKAVSYVVK